MPSIVDLLGEQLLAKENETVSTASFAEKGKIIGLYFSAHWCPPCRLFTPNLASWYSKFKTTEKGQCLEIVFVSSDRDDASFNEYYSEMPWHALPLAEKDKKAKLSKQFKVQGIPMLVFVEGETGKLITADGRSCVTDDPDGKDFPWYPQPLSSMLTGPLRRGQHTVQTEAALKAKVTAFYFSAHWCPPCRAFTPTLCDIYNKLQAQGKGWSVSGQREDEEYFGTMPSEINSNLQAEGKEFECVFISSDRSEESFEEYFGTMPFLAVPYNDARCKQLAKHFNVQGIPALIILDEQLEVITTNGRAMLIKDKDAKDFPWHPKPLVELDESSVSVVNEQTSLLLLTDGDESFVTEARELLSELAANHKLREKQGSVPELAFLYEGPNSDDIADSIRDFAALPDSSPLVVILDITGQQKFVFPPPDGATSYTKDSVAALVDKFVNNNIDWVPLRK